jgi:hypothetical protein
MPNKYSVPTASSRKCPVESLINTTNKNNSTALLKDPYSGGLVCFLQRALFKPPEIMFITFEEITGPTTGGSQLSSK